MVVEKAETDAVATGAALAGRVGALGECECSTRSGTRSGCVAAASVTRAATTSAWRRRAPAGRSSAYLEEDMPIGKLTVVHTVEEMEEEACSHQKQGLPTKPSLYGVPAAEVVAAADADASAMRRAGAGRGGRGGARGCREPGRSSRARERLLATSSAEAQQSVQQAEARQEREHGAAAALQRCWRRRRVHRAAEAWRRAVRWVREERRRGEAAVRMQCAARQLAVRRRVAGRRLVRRQEEAAARLAAREAEVRARKAARARPEVRVQPWEPAAAAVEAETLAAAVEAEALMEERGMEWAAEERPRAPAAAAEVAAMAAEVRELEERCAVAERARGEAEAAAATAEAKLKEHAGEQERFVAGSTLEVLGAHAEGQWTILPPGEGVPWELKNPGAQDFEVYRSRGKTGLTRETAVQTCKAAVQTSEAAVQTEREAGCHFETTAGPRLHPAQTDALERAEHAAAQVERIWAEMERRESEVEARAARYCSVEQPDTEATGEVGGGATVASAPNGGGPKARTGGRQVAKARARKQAAEQGLDVQHWLGVREQRMEAERQLALAAGGGDEWRTVLEARLEPRREQWRQQQAAARFREAAAGAGISVLDSSE